MSSSRSHLAASSTTSATSKPIAIFASTSPAHLETEFDETDDDISLTGTSDSSPPATSPVSQRHQEHDIVQYLDYDQPTDFHPFQQVKPCDDEPKQFLGAESPAMLGVRSRTPSAISLAILKNASEKTKPCELVSQQGAADSTGSAQDGLPTTATTEDGSSNAMEPDRPQLTGRSTTYTHAHRPAFISTTSASRKQSSNSITSASPALLSPLLSSLPNRLNFFKDHSTRSQNAPTSPQSPQFGIKMMNDGARKVTGLEGSSRPQAIRKGSGASVSYRSRTDRDDSGVERSNVYTSCGRHGDDWLFGGFSLGGTVKKILDVRMEGRAQLARPN